MICLSFVAANLSGQNLFVNGDFETGLLAPWVAGGDNNAVIVADAFEGDWAAKGHLEFYLDSLEEGATYYWRAYAKCLGDCGTSNMWIGVKDLAADTLIRNFNFTEYTDYDTIVFSFIAGAGNHRFFQWGQNGGQYVTDDHLLYKEGTNSIDETLAEAKKIQISTTTEGILINIEESIRKADIQIHDLAGKLVFSQEASFGRTLINHNELAVSGIYVVTVQTDKTRKMGKVSIATN